MDCSGGGSSAQKHTGMISPGSLKGVYILQHAEQDLKKRDLHIGNGDQGLKRGSKYCIMSMGSENPGSKYCLAHTLRVFFIIIVGQKVSNICLYMHI